MKRKIGNRKNPFRFSKMSQFKAKLQNLNLGSEFVNYKKLEDSDSPLNSLRAFSSEENKSTILLHITE